MKKIINVLRAAFLKVCSKENLRIMKLTTLLLLVAVLNAFGSESYSQKARLNLDVKDVPIQAVLSSIENQSEFFFLYSSKMIDVDQKVDIQADRKDIFEVLDELLADTDIRYTVKDRQILLMSKNMNNYEIVQQVRITGTVIDESGSVLPGVTVIVKGTTLGALTDLSGKYTLANVPIDATLVFSFVGMTPMEIPVSGKNQIDVVMKQEAIGLEEVVVIGYGTQKKRDVSTSIASVSTEALKDKPVASFTTAMSGQMAGVRILSSNNAPGGGSIIRIRGVSSINATNDPLIVIDGFPLKDGFDQTQNPLNSINTADIESIEVLKDASSSAIYGAQAANGVILITTKKGRIGKPTINISVSTGMEQMIHKMDVFNREDFLKSCR